MNGFLKTTIGGAAFTVIYIFAAHGKAFFDSMHAGWLFFVDVTKEAPLGLAAFLLALALASASQPFLHRWLPTLRCPLSREFLIESAALVIGVAVMWAQLRTLPALMLGTLAGFMAPYVHKGIHVGITLIGRSFKGGPP